MFCYQCGCPVDANDRYCPQCGAQLIENQQEPLRNAVVNKYFDIELPVGQPKEIVRGYILTHVEALAKHLDVRGDDIRDILEEFVAIRSKVGIVYQIIDMGNYFNNPKNAQWTDFHRILSKHYLEDSNNHVTPDYLFIIGGCDIVPMPSIPVQVHRDKDIDADLPYEYLYEDHIESSILNHSIFKKKTILLCGRLPLASDTTFAVFVRMLHNTLMAGMKGLRNMNLHAQCDPNWKNVTALAVEGFRKHLPQRFEKNDMFHGPVMLTPQFETQTIAFESNFPYRQASVFYYNLHGTNMPDVDPFVGYTLGNGERKSALLPQNMASVMQPNMVVTEACYGGWFKRSDNQRESKQKHETILLSAMHAATVCYVGSSRVAYGTVDTSHPPQLSLADVLANAFLQSLYKGSSAGVALHRAKTAVLNSLNGEESLRFITILEFNLFGDPTLAAVTSSDGYGHKSCESTLLHADAPILLECKVEYDSKTGHSLLDTVRNLVNRNLREINSLLTNHLYSMYGVIPRQLNCVMSHKLSDGTCQYTYSYEAANGEWLVGIDKQSKNILYAVCSK